MIQVDDFNDVYLSFSVLAIGMTRQQGMAACRAPVGSRASVATVPFPLSDLMKLQDIVNATTTQASDLIEQRELECFFCFFFFAVLFLFLNSYMFSEQIMKQEPFFFSPKIKV